MKTPIEFVTESLQWLDSVTTAAIENTQRFRKNCEEKTGEPLDVVVRRIRQDPASAEARDLLPKLWVLGGMISPFSGLFYALGMELRYDSSSPQTKLACLLLYHVTLTDPVIGEFVQAVADVVFANGAPIRDNRVEMELFRDLVYLGAIKPPPVEG